MKSFIVEKKYILFPVSMDAPCKMVTVCSEGEKIFEFDIPVENGNSPYRFQYYAPLNVEKWKGQKMTIEVEDALDFLEAVGFSDDRVDTVQHKPQIHFSPESGCSSGSVTLATIREPVVTSGSSPPSFMTAQVTAHSFL